MNEKYPTMVIICKSIYYIENYGYVARKYETSDNPSTATIIKNNYQKTNDACEISKYDKFIDWLKAKNFSDGFKSAKEYCLEYDIESWKIPFVCAAVKFYFDDIERRRENEKFRVSKFQSEIGKREEFFLKLHNVKRIGDSLYLHQLRDRDYNLYTFVKPSPMNEIDINECALIRATVKNHYTKTYGDFSVKETQLNRPKIVQNVGKKENENE